MRALVIPLDASARAPQNDVEAGLSPVDPPYAEAKQEPDKNLARSWAQSGDKFWAIGATHESLPPGIYAAGADQSVGVFLERMENKTDQLLHFPDSAADEVLKEMQQFQDARPLYEKHGFLHKRGILLEGPPGSGKTSTIQQLIDLVVRKRDGIALFIEHPAIGARALRMVRGIEKERQVMVIMEDFDGLLGNYGEQGFLSLLDGEAQVDNVVMVATTNYLNSIPERFRDRPSRFDLVKHIGMPSAVAREVYLRHKLPEVDDATLAQMVQATDNYSIAHLREFIALTQIFGQDIQKAADRLNKMSAVPKTGKLRRQSKSMGFGEVA